MIPEPDLDIIKYFFFFKLIAWMVFSYNKIYKYFVKIGLIGSFIVLKVIIVFFIFYFYCSYPFFYTAYFVILHHFDKPEVIFTSVNTHQIISNYVMNQLAVATLYQACALGTTN